MMRSKVWKDVWFVFAFVILIASLMLFDQGKAHAGALDESLANNPSPVEADLIKCGLYATYAANIESNVQIPAQLDDLMFGMSVTMYDYRAAKQGTFAMWMGSFYGSNWMEEKRQEVRQLVLKAQSLDEPTRTIALQRNVDQCVGYKDELFSKFDYGRVGKELGANK